jgi:hypothetical protein
MWKRMTLWPHRRERARERVATGKIEVSLLGPTEMVGHRSSLSCITMVSVDLDILACYDREPAWQNA